MAKRKQTKDNGKSIRKKLATLVTTSGKNKEVVEKSMEKEANEHELTSGDDTDSEMDSAKVRYYLPD
mgnify:FL=1